MTLLPRLSPDRPNQKGSLHMNRITILLLATSVLAAGCASSTTSESTTTDEATTGSTAADTTAEATSTDGETTGQTISGGTSSATATTEAVDAAETLINALSGDQIADLLYDYGDSAIVSTWSNLPACDGSRAGVQHGDLDEAQIDSVLSLADAVLSDEGAIEYRQIIAADEELGGGDGEVWDADCYYMAIFGTPSASDAWALQFGGHHYARTVTFDNGATTITPSFTGVEPREFTLDGESVMPLADEGETMFALFATLDSDQLASAELGGSYDAIELGPGSDAFPSTEGFVLSEASEETRTAVLAAIRAHVDDFDSDLADSVMATVESQLDETFVGWSNSIDSDTESAYGRIDGPTVWIEFVNESGVGGNEIHHHSVYRDKANDYGSAG